MKKLLLLTLLSTLPLKGISQTYFSDNFNDGNSNGWTLIDSDGDGNNWFVDSNGSLRSNSWNGSALNPNNWIVSSAIDLSTATGVTQLEWLVTASDDTTYDNENYSVYVSTSNTLPSFFTSPTSFTENLNGVNLNFQQRTLDVSSYNGQTIYVAIRHYNSFDQWYMLIDDITVKKLATNDIEFTSFTNINDAYPLNSTVTVQGNVKNTGSNTITSFDLEWDIDGGTTNSQTFSGLNIVPGATYNFIHATTWNATPTGQHSLNGSITSVNNSTDPDTSNNTNSINLMVVNEVFAKKVVYEEATGTWCGFCPRGHVGLKDMAHNYPNDFIGIAVHNGDPMTVTEYDNGIGNYIGGYPSGLLNRKATEVDPGIGDLEPAFLNELNKIPLGKIEISSHNWNPTTREITLNLDTTFALDMNGVNYNIAAIIVENGVTGTTSGYNQSNYYAGGTTDLIDFEGINWKNLPNPVLAADMVYDHVGRAVLGGWSGQSGIIPTNVTYNNTYSTTLTHTLPVDQNENKIELVALLINNSNGEITNAYKIDLDTSALSSTNFVKKSVKVYPNPSTSIFNFEVDGIFDINIVDITGKTVYTKNKLFNNAKINLSNLNKGIYFAKVSNNNSEQTLKLVVK